MTQQNGKRKAVNVTGPNGSFVGGYNQKKSTGFKRGSIQSLLLQKNGSNSKIDRRSNERSKAKQNAMEYLWANKHLSTMSERGRYVWNFGYGANINPWKLQKKRGIRPIGDTLRGKLVGWRLLFDHKGGFGNVINAKTESDELRVTKFKPFTNDKVYEVHGVLLKLTHSDFIQLAQMESRYDLYQVSVQIYSEDMIESECVDAIGFKSPMNHRTKTSDLLPTKRYIDLIRRGAEQMNLNKKYIDWLYTIRGIDSKKRGNEYFS